MKTKLTYLAIGLFLVLGISSCANLQHINTFATVSTKALNSETSIGYSFALSCKDFDCNFGKEVYFFPKTQDEIDAAFITPPKCDCDAFINADKALTTINSVINAYLTGLANLSDGKAVNYNYGNLVSAINTANTKLSISSADVTALGNIATIVSNDLMNAYRKNKLKEIIKKTDPAFQATLTVYIKQMDIFKNVVLGGDLDKLARSYNRYLYDNGPKLSPYEKGKIYEDYLNRKAKMISYQNLTDNFVNALKQIQQGHAALVKDADHLTEDNVKEIINSYSADIFSLVSEFNNLKTSN